MIDIDHGQASERLNKRPRKHHSGVHNRCPVFYSSGDSGHACFAPSPLSAFTEPLADIPVYSLQSADIKIKPS
jgi:hypothetical protein